MKRLLSVLLVSMLLIPAAHAEATPSTPIDPPCRVGSIIDLSASKRWGRVNVMLQGSIFTLGTQLERAMTIGKVEADIIPQYLRFQFLGYYFYHLSSGNQYYHKLRYHLGVGGDLYYHPTSLSWSVRYESTYTLTKSTPYNRLRPRIRCNFYINSSAWQPFAEVEFFWAFNGKNQGRADRMWYNAGVSYAINRSNKVEFKIREEQTWLTTPKQWNTFIGFAYKVTL